MHFLQQRRRLNLTDGDSASECLHLLKSLTYINAFLTCACALKAPEAETGIYECIFQNLELGFGESSTGKYKTF